MLETYGETVYVTLKSGENYVAEVVWSDSNMDISIIKIAANNLIKLEQGDSDDISLGEEIYMISNPTGYDLDEKIQASIISEKDKTFKIVEENSINYIEDIMKINVDIETDQTGSPILNESGELIGIASSKLNSIIPINRIKNIIQKLEEEGEFEEAYLGVYGFDNNVIEYLELGIESQTGVYVEKIDENSSAYGEILSGDIITMIDETEITRMQDLTSYIYTKSPNDVVKLTIIRDTKQLEIEITLESNTTS